MKRNIALVIILVASQFGEGQVGKPYPNRQVMVKWEDYLDSIATVESRMHTMAVDPTGPYNGRGIYQISEPVLVQYKWSHPDAFWITPDMLYNSNIARPIALWYLNWLDTSFRKIGINNMIVPCVLSGYNMGLKGTIDYGVRYQYVEKVLSEYEKRYGK